MSTGLIPILTTAQLSKIEDIMKGKKNVDKGKDQTVPDGKDRPQAADQTKAEKTKPPKFFRVATIVSLGALDLQTLKQKPEKDINVPVIYPKIRLSAGFNFDTPKAGILENKILKVKWNVTGKFGFPIGPKFNRYGDALIGFFENAFWFNFQCSNFINIDKNLSDDKKAEALKEATKNAAKKFTFIAVACEDSRYKYGSYVWTRDLIGPNVIFPVININTKQMLGNGETKKRTITTSLMALAGDLHTPYEKVPAHTKTPSFTWLAVAKEQFGKQFDLSFIYEGEKYTNIAHKKTGWINYIVEFNYSF